MCLDAQDVARALLAAQIHLDFERAFSYIERQLIPARRDSLRISHTIDSREDAPEGGDMRVRVEILNPGRDLVVASETVTLDATDPITMPTWLDRVVASIQTNLAKDLSPTPLDWAQPSNRIQPD